MWSFCGHYLVECFRNAMNCSRVLQAGKSLSERFSDLPKVTRGGPVGDWQATVCLRVPVGSLAACGLPGAMMGVGVQKAT